MTKKELYEKSFQKIKDGGSFALVKQFLIYQEASNEDINDIMEALKEQRIKGVFYSEAIVKEEREEHFYGGIFAVIMGFLLFGMGFAVLYSGWISILSLSLMAMGAIFFIGGLVKILKHLLGK